MLEVRAEKYGRLRNSICCKLHHSYYYKFRVMRNLIPTHKHKYLQHHFPGCSLMTTYNLDYFQCFFQNWITQQHEDLDELLNAIPNNSETADEELKLLGEKGIKHFEEYCERRALMVKHDATLFMCPVWCSSFENAFLWIGGCRPSLSIRLVYSVCGSELDAQLTEFLQGQRKGNLAEMSAHQLDMINTLHFKTIKEEEKMSNRMASLQEEIADDPLALIAKNSRELGEWSEDLHRTMNAHSLSLAGILVEADRLRLNTLKDLIGILTPIQAVDLLVATKKLHLSIHEWGKKRDCQFGETF